MERRTLLKSLLFAPLAIVFAPLVKFVSPAKVWINWKTKTIYLGEGTITVDELYRQVSYLAKSEGQQHLFNWKYNVISPTFDKLMIRGNNSNLTV